VAGSVFGQIIPPWVIENMVIDVLESWMEEYLVEINNQWPRDGLTTYEKVRSWNVRPTADRWTEDQIPAGIVVSPGLEDTPIQSGDGYFTARYRVGVVIFAGGNGTDSARASAGTYGAAAHAILLHQKRELGGICTSVEWDGESFTDGEDDMHRSLSACTEEFILTVEGVVRRNGPTEHGQSGNWPDVRTTDLGLEKE
jgi:hypothetical protein